MGFKIDGVRDVLDELNVMLSMRDTNAILKQGAQPLLNQMKQNASNDPKVVSGKLRSALGVEGRSGKTVTIGVHRKDWSDDKYYPSMVEFVRPDRAMVRAALDAALLMTQHTTCLTEKQKLTREQSTAGKRKVAEIARHD